MKFNEIYSLQKELDLVIFKEHDLNYHSTFRQRGLALIVELAELANEIREFKFWSKKGPSDKALIIEEYVDGIHFITSLGISIDIDFDHDIVSEIYSTNLTEYFLKLNVLVNTFLETKQEEDYLKLLYTYLGLGEVLDISTQELADYYKLKNEKNHLRQKENY